MCLRFALTARVSPKPTPVNSTAASVDRPSLPVFVPLVVALKRCSLYRQPHEVANRGFELLLLFPIVHHHERVDCLFPPLHEVMVSRGEAGWGGFGRPSFVPRARSTVVSKPLGWGGG